MLINEKCRFYKKKLRKKIGKCFHKTFHLDTGVIPSRTENNSEKINLDFNHAPTFRIKIVSNI